MRKIILAAVVSAFVLLSFVVLADCPQITQTSDISSEDNFSTECLQKADPASLTLDQAKSRFSDLTDAQRDYFYKNNLNDPDIERFFGIQHDIVLSGCTQNCRYEGGRLYNPPMQDGIPISQLAGAKVAARPGGGFDITAPYGVNFNILGNTFRSEETDYMVSVGPEPGGTGGTVMTVHIIPGQTVTVNGEQITGKSSDGTAPGGTEVNCYSPSQCRIGGSFALLRWGITSGSISDGSAELKPLPPDKSGNAALNLMDLSFCTGPFCWKSTKGASLDANPIRLKVDNEGKWSLTYHPSGESTKLEISAAPGKKGEYGSIKIDFYRRGFPAPLNCKVEVAQQSYFCGFEIRR